MAIVLPAAPPFSHVPPTSPPLPPAPYRRCRLAHHRTQLRSFPGTADHIGRGPRLSADMARDIERSLDVDVVAEATPAAYSHAPTNTTCELILTALAAIAQTSVPSGASWGAGESLRGSRRQYRLSSDVFVDNYDLVGDRERACLRVLMIWSAIVQQLGGASPTPSQIRWALQVNPPGHSPFGPAPRVIRSSAAETRRDEQQPRRTGKHTVTILLLRGRNPTPRFDSSAPASCAHGSARRT